MVARTMRIINGPFNRNYIIHSKVQYTISVKRIQLYLLVYKFFLNPALFVVTVLQKYNDKTYYFNKYIAFNWVFNVK